MPPRALSFGSAAQAYERFRPGYPPELVAVVLEYADGPVHTALEIGAGTGKATRAFADRGIAVTATEPDPAMLAELRRTSPHGVHAQQRAFEDLQLSTNFDLVYAAASLHWTNPEGRWERAAELLTPGGIFASFGGPYRLTDPDLEDVFRTARAPYLDDDSIPEPRCADDLSTLQWPGNELSRSALFDDVREMAIERRFSLLTKDFIGYLSTVSAYLALPESTRTNALDAISAALPDGVEITADLTVHLARRR